MRQPRVVVIGAGFGGLATAVKLTRAGFEDVTIVERSAGPGGTWWDCTYPGVQVDLPSHAYCFSFFQDYDWSGTHADGAELQAYAEATLDRFDLRRRSRFGVGVAAVRWDEQARRNAVVLDDGTTLDADLVVSCCGLFNVPALPAWPGLETFAGPAFHAARYEHHHDLGGKRVAVVGTGSSAAQLVPALAGEVGELLVFQREPGWIIPKGDRDYTPRERTRYRRQRWRIRLERYAFFLRTSRYLNHAHTVGSRWNRKMTRVSLDQLDAEVPDPALRELVRPRYPWGCKREVIASSYLPALGRDDVRVVPHAVAHVTPTGLVDASGAAHDVDAVVMATGFLPFESVRRLQVVGRGGRRLADTWAVDPAAFLGMAIPGFPNLLVLYGPNTNGGSSTITQLELQAQTVVWAARRLRRGGRVIEVRPRAFAWFVRWVDRANAAHKSAGTAGCHNYYLAASGRNVTQWPSSHLRYRLMSLALVPLGLAVRR